MPNYYDGLADGQRFAGTMNTASEGADAVRGLFRGPATSWADEARALKTELAVERAKRTLSWAAIGGLEAVIAQLPPEHRAAFDAVMGKVFDQACVQRARELGFVESHPGQAAEAAAMMRRDLIGRR